MIDFKYTTNPGYVDLFTDMYRAIRWYYFRNDWGNYTFPSGFVNDLNRYYHFPIEDTFPIIAYAIVFTALRYFFELVLCKHLLAWLKVDNKSEEAKFPESFWKFLVYSVLWAYSCYLLVFSGRYNYFTEPEFIWDDWEIRMEVLPEIKLLYFIECGFYLHSVYATIFMDLKRKDFFVMLLHHFLTMALIVFSYAVRYHKIGLLVLFVHDVTDILLEFTKCNVYIKNRNGKYFAYNEHISNIGFAIFTIAWFVFRLYWFPLKVLYTAGIISAHRAYYRGAGLYFLFNSLLWILLVLDIYWFYFIVLFLYKVATGQLKEINDTRDYDDEASEKEKKKKKN